MVSNSRPPQLCLRHSAFASCHNIRRERSTTSMSQWMSAIFLGTSSGGGPTESRNCSSLVLDIVGDGSLWSSYLCSNRNWLTYQRPIVVDGAEGTLRQFALQPEGGRVFQVAKVNKIFVTHMHCESFSYVPLLHSPTIKTQRTTSWVSRTSCATSSASPIQKRSLRVAHP